MSAKIAGPEDGANLTGMMRSWIPFSFLANADIHSRDIQGEFSPVAEKQTITSTAVVRPVSIRSTIESPGAMFHSSSHTS